MIRNWHAVEPINPIKERVNVELVHSVKCHPICGGVVVAPPQRRAGIKFIVVVAKHSPRVVKYLPSQPLCVRRGVLVVRGLRKTVVVPVPRSACRDSKRRVWPKRHALNAAAHGD
eukprot:scaffold47449_cov110-Phaeocystis_antarctica.AAC.7